MKHLSFILIILFLTCLTSLSCQTPPSEVSDNENMKPTSEYNYLLDPETTRTLYKYIGPFPEGSYPDSDDLFPFIQDADISGKTDGTNIVVEATYSYSDEYSDYAGVLAKLPKNQTRVSGSIRKDKLIGYVKLPGLQSVFDSALELSEINTPEGAENEFKSSIGMISAFVNPQEELFKWMGSEMGVVSYIAVDQGGVQYLNSAFAIEIKDSKTAQEKIHNLFRKVSMFVPAFNPDELIETSQYKTFMMDILDTSVLNEAAGGPENLDFGFGEITPGIMYTDDWLFISDQYGLKQLADIYNPGGALSEAGTVSWYVDWDKTLEYSSRYEESFFNSLKQDFELSPEQQAEFQKYRSRFEKMKLENDFGETKLILKMNESNIEARLETTQAVVELMQFLQEWIYALDESDGEAVETNA